MRRFRRERSQTTGAPKQFNNLWRHFPHHAQICSSYSLYFIVVLSPFSAPRPRKGFSLRTKCAIKAMADHFSIKLCAVVHFIILTGLERRENNIFGCFHPQSRLYEMFILGSGRLFSVNRFYFRKERKKKFERKRLQSSSCLQRRESKINRTRQEKMAFHHSGRVPQSGECMPSTKKGQHRRDRRRKHFSNNCD